MVSDCIGVDFKLPFELMKIANLPKLELKLGAVYTYSLSRND
jgi:hypothetical protein